ncbi:MAG: hypothetical protein QOE90_2017 [Thermoplasmata archaeon]|jgi:hypothetical protein|nr:hypothetical protein [Thermoplasmata archaeon]
MDAESTFTIVGNLAIALSFVVALVFGVAQVRAAARDRKERLTIETIRAMQSREMAAHFHRIRVTPPPKTMRELYALPDDEQIALIQFAQEMEMLGLLVFDGIIEIDLVERTLGDFVKNAWEKSRPLFEQMRAEIHDPYLAEYFEWLAKRLEARMRDQPRAPAYAPIARKG